VCERARANYTVSGVAPCCGLVGVRQLEDGDDTFLQNVDNHMASHLLSSGATRLFGTSSVSVAFHISVRTRNITLVPPHTTLCVDSVFRSEKQIKTFLVVRHARRTTLSPRKNEITYR
jgi:hypothetical protein